MPTTQNSKMTLDDGQEVSVRPIKRVGRDVTRIQVTAGAKWRLDVTGDEIVDIVTTWDEDGQLADVPVPEWMDLVLGRLA